MTIAVASILVLSSNLLVNIALNGVKVPSAKAIIDNSYEEGKSSGCIGVVGGPRPRMERTSMLDD